MKQPKSVVVNIYDVAIFECTAKSYGNTSIVWRKWNSKLPVTAKVMNTKLVNKMQTILRIENSIGYYKGYYYCAIANDVGMISSTFAYLNITGKISS